MAWTLFLIVGSFQKGWQLQSFFKYKALVYNVRVHIISVYNF